MKATYNDEHVEEFKILPGEIVEWISAPGKMRMSMRICFDRLIEELHIIMLEAGIKKIEVESEEV